MFEGISIEEFYMLYKVGEAAGAVSVPFCILSFFSGATVVGLFITIVAGCKEDEAKARRIFRPVSFVFLALLMVATPLVFASKVAPTFGEVKAFVALKVGEKAANSETAQRLIDVAISKLEEKENK